ncbi:hypothetical protein M0R45_002034 [Rubus argutus]|uniref:Uncharacterized protein n=1 Tax=Rubus argutus TaxID=59490 RepID=A0AAW1VKR0_RUBAR
MPNRGHLSLTTVVSHHRSPRQATPTPLEPSLPLYLHQSTAAIDRIRSRQQSQSIWSPSSHPWPPLLFVAAKAQARACFFSPPLSQEPRQIQIREPASPLTSIHAGDLLCRVHCPHRAVPCCCSSPPHL